MRGLRRRRVVSARNFLVIIKNGEFFKNTLQTALPVPH